MIHHHEFKIKFNPSQVINEKKSLGIYRNLYYELRYQSWMKDQFVSVLKVDLESTILVQYGLNQLIL